MFRDRANMYLTRSSASLSPSNDTETSHSHHHLKPFTVPHPSFHLTNHKSQSSSLHSEYLEQSPPSGLFALLQFLAHHQTAGVKPNHPAKLDTMMALDSRERTTALTPRSLPRKLNPEFRWLPEDPSVQIQKVQCINCENYGPHGAGAAFHPSRMDKHLQECAPYIEKCGGVIPPRPEGPKSRKRTNGASASGEEDLEGLGQEYRLLEELEREGNAGAFGERHRIIEMPSADVSAFFL